MGQSASSRSRKDTKGDERDDVKRQIDSDAGETKPIYQLVNVKTGGGRLIELIKTQARQHSGSFNASFVRNTSLASRQENGEGLAGAGGSLAGSRADSLDEQIRKLVVPLLYNGGRGKLVPLARLWSCRLGMAGGQKLESEKEEEREAGWQESAGADYRWVCWKLEERGFVGETALHICFLLSTPSHMILARKLLELFPMLINDIYTCDEYFGESSLHMAIVNENVKIVRLLLDHGANVHERCLGSFFLPHDQKARANLKVRRQLENERAHKRARGRPPMSPPARPLAGQLDLQANHFSSPQTNYEGYTYWGEFPLSFAASLGLPDCYKLLLAKGANPNRRDSNGNSSLHICVIADRLDMFDLCYATGAHLGSLNRLGLSPLALAARLCRVQMFFHILTIQRQVSWLFCNVAFLDYPLKGIDSIDTTSGLCDDHSVLSIVVSGNSNEHLQMLDGLLSDLLQVKWDTSLRHRFRSWLAMFLFLLLIASLAYVTRFNETLNPTTTTNKARRSQKQAVELLNLVSELALIASVLYYLATLMSRCLVECRAPSGYELEPSQTSGQQGAGCGALLAGLARLLAQAPELSIFTLTCVLILLCIPLRLLKLTQWENFLVAIIMFLLPLKLLFFCRGSKSLGSFIVMIYKILMNDVLCFVVFLIIFISGFAQSFVIIFKTYRPRSQTSAANSTDHLQLTNLFESIVGGQSHFLDLFDALITMHMMALNEFNWVLDEFQATDYPNLARLLFCVYMILVSILLINMLIAMLGKTYQDISSQPNENLRQWARALLTLERFCSRASRLEMLDKYSHFVQAQQCRCYSSTWALTTNDLEQINTIKRLKRDQAANERRLKARSSLPKA